MKKLAGRELNHPALTLSHCTTLSRTTTLAILSEDCLNAVKTPLKNDNTSIPLHMLVKEMPGETLYYCLINFMATMLVQIMYSKISCFVSVV